MKSSHVKTRYSKIILSVLTVASFAAAQPAARPLDIHGLDQFSIAGVRSRAMGGANVAGLNDATALFSNPAALSQLSSIEIRVGGLVRTSSRKQTQEWVPFRTNPGLSVLFEGLSGSIKMPTDSAGNPLDPWETLQRQYDDIKPNWDKHTSGVQPLSFVAAVPLTVADFNIVAGIGYSQVINLDHYYQNNNSMSPYLGQQRPDPKLINARTDTLHIKWYQYIRSREGAVNGITPGLSVTLLPGLRIGGSATVLSGSSDDEEHRRERGHVNIAVSNGEGTDFMLDTVYYMQKKTGTSTYSGNIFNIGMQYQDEKYSIGLSVRPEMKLTRKWNRNVEVIDTTKKSFPVRIDSTRNYTENGKDYLDYPLAYSIGVVLTPTARWTIAFDYEMRYLGDMRLTTSTNSVWTRPWDNNSASMRLGAEYRVNDMIAVRGGYRDDVQAFAPDGSAIVDEPARGGIYSLGAGIVLDNIIVDIGYEYSILKYQDLYQSNVTYHTRSGHQLMMELAYRF